MSHRWVRLVAVVLLLLTACRREASQPHSDEPKSAVAPAPTFVNGGACEPVTDLDLPDEAACATSVSWADQRLFVYTVADRNDRPTTWHIRLVDGDHVEDRDLHAGTVTSYPRVTAVADVDRDGDPDWWVKTRDYASHGAPWGGLFLFIEEHRSIAPLHYEGAPLVIDFGGITRLGEGALCRDGDVILRRAEAKDRQNLTWVTSERRFEINGTRASLIDRTEGTLTIDDYNDPDLDPYYEVECYGANFSVFAPAET